MVFGIINVFFKAFSDDGSLQTGTIDSIVCCTLLQNEKSGKKGAVHVNSQLLISALYFDIGNSEYKEFESS